MSKARFYWTLVVGMVALGLAEAVTGFVLWLAFPEGGGGGRGFGGGGGIGNLTFWGITKHTWVDIHDWVAVALVALVLVHIVLHWKWLWRMTKNLFNGLSRKPAAVTVETN